MYRYQQVGNDQRYYYIPSLWKIAHKRLKTISKLGKMLKLLLLCRKAYNTLPQQLPYLYKKRHFSAKKGSEGIKTKRSYCANMLVFWVMFSIFAICCHDIVSNKKVL